MREKVPHSEEQKLRHVLCLRRRADRPAVRAAVNWTQNNLARGSLREHLPTGCGQSVKDRHTVGAGQQLRVRRRYLDSMVAAGRPVVCGRARYTGWARRC